MDTKEFRQRLEQIIKEYHESTGAAVDSVHIDWATCFGGQRVLFGLNVNQSFSRGDNGADLD